MLCARILQAVISRQKEFLADASSAQYTRNPQGLKSALQKIAALEQTQANITHIQRDEARECSHIFFLPSFSAIFSTHPPIAERIKRRDNIG